MNAQYRITTTPKYNFPLPTETLKLPQKFIDFSLRSLKRTQYLQGPVENRTTIQFPTTEYSESFPPTTSFLKLIPDFTKTLIVAVDVSSIKLGETRTGILLAIRGAIVWRQNNHYNYLRIGPFPFHITEKNKNEIHNLGQRYRKSHLQEYTSPNLLYTQTKLTMLLERWIQMSVNETTQDSLILWDGSLTAGTTETSIQEMEQMLRKARNNQNTILAFSKMTRLLLYGYRVTDLIWKHPSPCLLKMQSYPNHVGPMCLMGNIHVVKLTEDRYAFRLDMDKELSYKQSIEAVQKLLGNDLILQSYPETLRLAHIFSTFTANEVLGIQRCIAKESNMKIITRPNIRRVLFGRFGKGLEG